MRPIFFLVPGPLDTRTGGYRYDRQIITGLRECGWPVEVVELSDTFPQPTRTALDHTAQSLAVIPAGAIAIIDGLALGAMPAEAERERERLRLLALVHHPLAEETGLDRQVSAALDVSERRALAAVHHVVVTSRATARTLAHYQVERSRMTVIEPGTDRAALARGSRSATVHLLSVASVIPRKGHEALVRALATMADRRWHLTCVGSFDRHPETTRRVRAIVSENGLDDRVTFAGEVDAKALDEYYDAADLFVLATLHEGYGMAVAEALARGLPVISTATGAIDDLIAGAGVLVPPSDPIALARALASVIENPSVREELARGARLARKRLPSWADAVRRMTKVLSAV